MAKPGLKKKYIKLADGDFKKAWKLQKAAEGKGGTKKKAAKKKKAKKKTTRKKTTAKKVTKRKSTKKKTVKKSTPKRKAGRMAKKRKTTKKRTRRRSGGGGGKMQKVLMDGLAAAGGAIGAGVVANQIPLPDPRMKAALPIVAGIVLASTKMGRGPMARMVSVGMVAAGSLALMKQFAPNVPTLAGEEEDYLDYISPDAEERAMLGFYGQDDEEDDLDDLLGAPVAVGQDEDLDEDDFDDLLGASVAVGGGDDFVSTADW